MKPVILLLEDDLQLSDTVKQFLELKGYRVLSAYDGYRAQEILYEQKIDLMLLDVKVPHINGFEILKEARASGKQIPVIFTTSLNSVDDVEKGFSLGCDDYIRKPFALKELLVRIEAQLKRSFSTYEEKIQLTDEIVFDIKEQRLLRNGDPVSLKAKELKLLTLFLQHPNELLTYDRIYEALWRYDEVPSGGSLRAYIKQLRSVLGKASIETVKNVGYRFVTE